MVFLARFPGALTLLFGDWEVGMLYFVVICLGGAGVLSATFLAETCLAWKLAIFSIFYLTMSFKYF